LARDEQKEAGDIKASFTPLMVDGKLQAEKLQPLHGETLRFHLKTKEGDVLLTDYAYCGKQWDKDQARISVWLNTTK
jgi:hypothetical protein